ncbi:MAG: hypothetical protein ACOX2F_02900 [bacterium]
MKKGFFLFIFILFTPFFAFSVATDPFTVEVEVEEGETVAGWEEQIFGVKEKKKEQKQVEVPKEKESKENKRTVTEKPLPQKREQLEATEIVEELNESPLFSEPFEVKEKEEDKEEKEYGKESPNWGRYYGENNSVYATEKIAENRENEGGGEVAQKEPFLFPIDLLLWSHGGYGYNPMVNAGIKASFRNFYSILSVGTDFSAEAARPLSFGVAAGGFYRIRDFSITADLGYEKVWDFGHNQSINNYALGLRAGVNYSVFSWFAVSAGAGLNYSVFNNSNFEKGKFIPMIFGGFQFNIIK